MQRNMVLLERSIQKIGIGSIDRMMPKSMAIKCLLFQRVNVLIFLVFVLSIHCFSQESGRIITKEGLIQIHSFKGIYHSFNKETNILSLFSNDSLLNMRIFEQDINPVSYQNFLTSFPKWDELKKQYYLAINYYIRVFYKETEKALRHEFVCLDISVLDKKEINPTPKVAFDTTIISKKGILRSVELGDYLHIVFEDLNGKINSYWIASVVDKETEDRLYALLGDSIEEKVQIKFCKTISYVHEVGRPIINDTCIELIFLQ